MKNYKQWGASLLILVLMCFTSSCTLPSSEANQPQSNSGVQMATTKVATDLSGHTIEQNNIIARYTEDNKPGAIKHFYIFSAYSGQCMLYSTVKGKVTSSGKRLSPMTVNCGASGNDVGQVNWVDIAGKHFATEEVTQDDGTYGSSVEYIYWWDSRNIYHQQYVTSGMLYHISNQPISVKGVILNLETTTSQSDSWPSAYESGKISLK